MDSKELQGCANMAISAATWPWGTGTFGEREALNDLLDGIEAIWDKVTCPETSEALGPQFAWALRRVIQSRLQSGDDAEYGTEAEENQT